MSLVDKVIGTGRRVATALTPHVPTMLVVGGSIAVCTGSFFACKATLRLDEIIQEHKEEIERLDNSFKTLNDNGIEYTEAEKRKDTFVTYCATSGKIVRLYGPSVGLIAVGFASIFYGFGLIKKWHAIALSSVVALDDRFREYRGRVIEELGEDMDKKFSGVRTIDDENKETIELTIKDDEGEDKVVEKEVITLDITSDDFVRVFNKKNSSKWEDNYLMNDRFLTEREHYFTKHLQARRLDYVFLNTIISELGFGNSLDGEAEVGGEGETEIGHCYGWTSKPGCHVCFNIQPYIKMFGSDDDEQFPMIVPLPVAYTDTDKKYDSSVFFINEEDEALFKQYLADDPDSVGYILTFNVDTDENGVPKQIISDVFKGRRNVNPNRNAF